MMVREPIPGLSKTENDAVAALAAIVAGVLVVIFTAGVIYHLLSGLPPIMLGGLLFAMFVFAMVCLGAFLRSNLSSSRVGPPQLKFRKPVRRRRKSPRPVGPKPLR